MKKLISSSLSVLLVLTPCISSGAAIKNATKSKEEDDNKNMPQAPKNIDKQYGQEGTLNESKSALISVDPLALQNYSQASNNFDFSSYDNVTLKSVILETLSHSNDLKSANEKVIQTELSYKEAIAGYLPTVDFSYSVKRTHNEDTGDDTIDTKEHKDFNDESYKFTLRQSLYAGGATEFKIKSLKSKVEEAKRKYRIVLEEEIQKAIKAYFGVLFNHKSVVINERNMEKLNKILEITQIKYDSGALSIGDLSAVKANIANASGKLIRVKSELADAIDFYVYTVGEDFRKTAPFEESFPINLTTLDALFEDIIENNLNLINYRLNIQSTKDKLLNMKASFKPKIDLELNYKNVLDKEGFTANETSYDGKVTLNYNLYNGGKDTIATMTVFSSLQELNYRYNEEVKKIKWETTKLFNSIKSLEETLLNTKKEVAASTEMVNSYWEGFQLGEQDLQVLLQGQRQLNGAELDLVKYEQDHITNIFKLLTSEGRLSEYFKIDGNHYDFIDFSNTSSIKQTPPLDLSKNNTQDKKTDDLNTTDLNITKEENFDLNDTNETLQTIEDLNQTIDQYLDVVKEANFDNIINFKDKFLEADDESYTIMISSFTNHYDAYNFSKKNRILEQSFSYEYFDKNGDFDKNNSKTKVINVKTNIAYGLYNSQDEANEGLNTLFEKDDKQYTIVKIKDIKELYNNYIQGLEAKVEPFVIKPKVIKTFMTNQEFKNKFLSAPKNYYSINIVSVPTINQAENLIKNENIERDSFVFKYGRNGMWVKIMFGVFSSYDQALETLSKHPELIKKYRPVIEQIGQKQDTYYKYKEYNPTPQWYLDEQKEKREAKTTPKENKKESKKIEPKQENQEVSKTEFLEDITLEENKQQDNIKILEKDNTQKESLPITDKEELLPSTPQVTDQTNEIIMEDLTNKEMKTFDPNQEIVPKEQLQESNTKANEIKEEEISKPIDQKPIDADSINNTIVPVIVPVVAPTITPATVDPLLTHSTEVQEVKAPVETLNSNLPNGLVEQFKNGSKNSYTIQLAPINENEKENFIKEYLSGKKLATSTSNGTSQIYYGVFENIQAARIAKFKLDPKLIDGIKLYQIGRINPLVLNNLKNEMLDTIKASQIVTPEITSEVDLQMTQDQSIKKDVEKLDIEDVNVTTPESQTIEIEEKRVQAIENANKTESKTEAKEVENVEVIDPSMESEVKDQSAKEEEVPKNPEITSEKIESLTEISNNKEEKTEPSKDETSTNTIVPVIVPAVVPVNLPSIATPSVELKTEEEPVQVIEDNKISNGLVEQFKNGSKNSYTIQLAPINENEKENFIKEYLSGKKLATSTSNGTSQIYYGLFENIQAARIAKFKLDPKLIDGIKLYQIGRINPTILSNLKDEMVLIKDEVSLQNETQTVPQQSDIIDLNTTKASEQIAIEEVSITPVKMSSPVEIQPIVETNNTIQTNEPNTTPIFDIGSYDQFQKGFEAAPKEYFTIEMGSVQTSQKDSFINRYIIDDQFAQINHGKNTTIYYGIFSTLEEAKKQQKNLHPKIINKVKIVKIGEIQ